jgi:hypothetical protein
MERYELGEEPAFQCLTRVSQHSNVKLRDAAAELVQLSNERNRLPAGALDRRSAMPAPGPRSRPRATARGERAPSDREPDGVPRNSGARRLSAGARPPSRPLVGPAKAGGQPVARQHPSPERPLRDLGPSHACSGGRDQMPTSSSGRARSEPVDAAHRSCATSTLLASSGGSHRKPHLHHRRSLTNPATRGAE